MKSELESITLVQENVRKVLEGVQKSFVERSRKSSEKYRFIAISRENGYSKEVIKALESYPLLNLVSVSTLPHVPESEKDYQLYTFRIKKANHGVK